MYVYSCIHSNIWIEEIVKIAAGYRWHTQIDLSEVQHRNGLFVARRQTTRNYIESGGLSV